MQYYDRDTYIYSDGEFVKAAEAGTDLFGQSLHYGYGAFEGLRAYNSHHGTRIFKAAEHFHRLERSCRAINLPYSWDNSHLVDMAYELLERNRLRAAYIRPLVFSGSNMHLTSAREARIMIAAWEWGPYLGHDLLRVCLSKVQRPNPRSFRVEAKVSGQYINAILASADATKNGYDEALLLDQEGFVAQASSENLFLEKGSTIYTPPLGNIFPGITRQTVIEICRDFQIEVVEKRLTVKDLHQADSAFLCGTAAEIIGIKEVDGIRYAEDWEHTIGASIQRKYKKLVLGEENYDVII